MYKIYLNAPDIFISTPDEDVKNFLLHNKEVDAFLLGKSKEPFHNSIFYRSFTEFLTDFVIEEAEVSQNTLAIVNLNIEATLFFKFQTEDNGSLLPCSNDPEEDEETWVPMLEFESLELTTPTQEVLKTKIEKYFLEVLKKEKYSDNLLR